MPTFAELMESRQQQPQAQPKQKTPYQQNVSQPVQTDKWYKGDSPTTRETMGRLMQITNTDPQRGYQLQDEFVQLQADPTSQYYNPYTKATNKAVSNLADLGFDVTNINDDWYNQNSWLKEYYVYTDNTNSLSSTMNNKKASTESKAAYQYNQLWTAEENTKKAEREWEALKQELSFWANDQSRNYSDDEIVNRIYGKDGSQFAKKYPTLAKMDETRMQGTPMELNRAIGYSTDAMYGEIWAARNGGSTGSIWKDMAMSATGEGNQWTENPDITARLNVNDPNTYAPYTVGSTMDDVLVYYNQPSFTKEWLLANKPDGTDATETKMWNQAWKAEEFTEQAESELESFEKRLNTKLDSATDVDKVMQWFDRLLEEDGYSSLKKLDKSLELVDGLVDTTRAINFSRNDVRRRAEEACARNAQKQDGEQTIINNGGKPGTAQDNDTAKLETQKVRDDSEAIEDVATDPEKNAFNNKPSSFFERTRQFMIDAGNANPLLLMQNNEQTTTNDYTNTLTSLTPDVVANYKARQQLSAVDAEMQGLSFIKSAVDTLGTLDEERYANILALMEYGDWDSFMETYGEILDDPQKASEYMGGEQELDYAYSRIYNLIHSNDMDAYYDPESEEIKAEVSAWWNILKNPDAITRYDALSETKAKLEAEIERTAYAEPLYDFQQMGWNVRIALYEQAGLDSTGLRTAKAVTGTLPFFSEYEATEWLPYSYYDSMQQEMGEGATAKQVLEASKDYTEQAKQNIEDAKFIKEYVEENGIQLPDGYMENIDRYIAKQQRTLDDYVYYSLRDRPDFVKMVERGKKIAEETGYFKMMAETPIFSVDNVLLDEMTEEERETVYYLLANPEALYSPEYDGLFSQTGFGDITGGQNEGFFEANNYVMNHLAGKYGVLQNRYRKRTEEGAREEVNSGLLGTLWANVKAIASAPIEAIAGGVYMLDTIITGDEYNPNNIALSFGHYSTTVNEQTSTNIKESKIIPDGIAKDIAMGAYEIIYNRGRSAANMIFGGPEIGGRLGSILNDTIGAFPMAIGAASMAIADAKEKGADDATAFMIGGVTLVMESFSEGFTRSNIMEALGGTKEEAVRSICDLAKQWLTSSGLQEAFGETATDFVENYVDEHWLGVSSDHQARVDKYIADNNLNPNNPLDVEEAEKAAREEEITGLIHTAIVSYLSPGLDVVGGAVTDRIRDFNNIRTATRNMQKQGMDVSIRDVSKEYRNWKQQAIAEETQTEQTAQPEQTAQTTTETENPNFEVEDVDADALFGETPSAETTETAPVAEAETTTTETETEAYRPENKRELSAADQDFLADLGRLDAVVTSDESTQVAAVTSLFSREQDSIAADMAEAAATNITDLFGGSMTEAVTTIRTVMLGARAIGADLSLIKEAMQTASLSDTSLANQVIKSEAFQTASPTQQAEMIAATVEEDRANDVVAGEMETAVHESRVASVETDLIKQGMLDGVKEAQKAAEAAKHTVAMAEESLGEKQSELEAKTQALQAATDEMMQNPTADNLHMLDLASNEVTKADAVVQEYEMHLENVQRANADAQAKLTTVQETAMRNLRQQAEQIVTQQDQQRKEREMQIAEQQRIAAEKAAQAQAEEDQRSGKKAETDTQKLAEEWADVLDLEGEKRENFIKRVKDRQEQRTLGKIDMTGKLNNAEGYLAIQAFGRKTGLKFELSDKLPNGTRGSYRNGVVYLNSRLVNNGSLTTGQALVEASLHEIPHSMEQTKSYKGYRKVVLASLFGVTNAKTPQAIYDSNEAYRTAINDKRLEYQKIGQKLDITEAEQEIVADFARIHLADKEVVQRFMDAGLGGKMRNALHNVNQALKNFFSGLTGEERKQAEYLRRAERAYQKGLNELAKSDVRNVENAKHSFTPVAQTADQSLAQADQDYQSAVENGDVETAQKMVDEAAEQAGYTDKVYHGTNSYGFTQFNMPKGRGLIFASYNKDLAGTYATEDGSGVYELYAKPGNQLVIDAEYHDWDDVPIWWNEDYPLATADTREIAKYAKENGYDSVRINNVVDNGSEGNVSGLTDVGIFFNQDDVKSADPVTRDDNGNVIPLSERFNTNNPDIRYSYEGEITDADIDQRLADAGVVPQESQQESVQFPVRYKYQEELATRKAPMVSDNGIRNNVLNDGLQSNRYDISEGKNPTRTLITFDSTPGNHIQNVLTNLGMQPVDVRKDNGQSERRIWATRDGTTIPMDEVENAVGKADTEFRNNNVSNKPASTITISKQLADTLNSFGWTIMDNSEYIGDGSYNYSDDVYDKNENKIGSLYGNGIMFDSAGYGKSLFDNGMLKGGTYRGSVWSPKENTNVRNGTVATAGPETGFSSTILSGETERPLEGMDVTMSTGQGPKVRAFAAKNGMLQDANQLDRFAKAVAMAQNTYFPDTNEEQIARAMNWIRSLRQTSNSDGYAEAIQAITRDDFDYRSADGQARMVATMGLANAKNDIIGQTALADAFMRQGTDLGRALQSRKLFKLMTPEGRISTLMKTLNDYTADLKKEGIDKKLQFSDWVLRAASAAETEEDFRRVQAVAASELAAQLPISWAERLNSLRMLSMLGNPRTHVRNFIGNMLFVPAVGLKNKIGALLELGVKKGERTKTLALVLDSDIRQFARQDARYIQSTLTGENKYDEHGLVQKAKNPIGSVLGALSNFNSIALEKEDWFFLRGHYRKALGGWMQANGYTVEQIQNDKALLEKGRMYAINEAQKATYRDFNGVAQKLNQLTRNANTPGQKALAFGVNAVLPFKKTPANILKRGIEYSPLGIARSVYNLYRYFKNGDMTATEVIDQFASGLSGSLVMALGFLLAGTGAVSCGFDDDDWPEELEGKQKYSINPGKAANEILGTFGVPRLFGEDVTYTLDWAAPMSMPLFVGASIRNQADTEGWDVNKVLNAMGSISEPVFNLSMLDGVNSLLKINAYSDENPMTQIAGKIVSNYVTSYVPALLGVIARSYDDTQRKSFVTKGQNTGLEGTARYAWESIENKIPGVSQSNIPVRDVWGNARTSSLAERIIENWVSPGYIEHVSDDPVVYELGRLADSVDKAKVKHLEPSHAATSISGAPPLGPQEYDTFDRVHGETQYSMLNELVNSDEYQDITDDDVKVEIIRKVYSYANEVAKAAILDDYRYEKQTVADFIHDGKVTDYKSKMIVCLKEGNYKGYGNYVEALREEGVEDSEIKRKISDTYRDQWKEAYRKYIETNDEQYSKQMDKIENVLNDTDFTFDISNWMSQVDKEYND